MKLVTLGFSPCPNDTFIFDALVHGRVESKVSFAAPLLEDVETLNNWAMEGRLDVTKLSFHALGYVLQDYCVLQAGSALGRGCGPLVVAARQLDLHADRSLTVAVPGKYTTASLLFRMFAPQCTNLVEMRFEKIIDSVAAGTVDAGVIIHESRFTYGEKGLHCLQDLGGWWEATSGFPIPLGCIAAKRSLGRSTLLEIDSAVRKSLEYAYAYPRECLPYVHRYAQEIEDDVVQDHINLYVNDFSLGLGTEGTQAIEHFLKRGRQAGILPHSRHALTLI
ncbi:MAG: 1,4-dihydroxy-6-naphthoate synthase [Desulfopila sp.]|jgi:1,4-dihydroxy-6-naphthoate synthase|nr:1,4-dihydroxy-6-naphthoate synthase [Desulfopila sp.]